MTPALHVRIYGPPAAWLRRQARTNHRSVGAETQFRIEQARVAADLVKTRLGRKTKPGPVGWGATKITPAQAKLARMISKFYDREEDRA